MKYFKRGNIWWGRWTVNGEQVRVSSKTSDERLAKQYLADEYAKSFRQERLGEKPRKTWAEAIERYLEDRKHLKSYNSYEAHKVWWDKTLKAKGLTYIDQLTPDVIRSIRDEELARPKERGGGQRSAGDVNRKIALIRAVMVAAHREYRWLDGEAPLYRFVSGERQRLRCLKPEEVVRLSKALPQGYSEMAMMAVATGLRRRNILRMKWDQIDFGKRLIRVDGELMKNGETLVLPLNQMAIDVLNRCRNETAWVFPLIDGKRPLNEVASKVWAKACEKAGLDDLRWHDLRHTWASLLRQNGVPMAVLKELGGWKDARMVERYAHLDVSHLSEHASVMDSAFGGVANRLRAVG